MKQEVIIRFDDVMFEYVNKRPLLKEANFSIRKGHKITLMGQNGAGKSTIFKLIKGELKPNKGKISINEGLTIGTAKQVVDPADFNLTIEEYFAKAFELEQKDLKSQISKVMEATNFNVPITLKVGDLSGGQKARLLLAVALIQKPDVLLLDEPTNNLDAEGIDHLISFLIMYEQTVLVISHDADFLNCFTEGVLYLDIYTKQVDNYVGDYYTVVEEITARIEREKKKNAQLKKQIQDRKDKVNFFANKGGKMRKLAKKLKDETFEMQENMVDVKRDDQTIRNFDIPCQEIVGNLVTLSSVKVIKNNEPIEKAIDIVLRQNSRLLISGPNGIGKSTLLRSLFNNESSGADIMEGVRIGYYSQDFTSLNFEDTVFDSLHNVMVEGIGEQKMRSIASGFLITGDLMGRKVSDLSEGQKGLLAFARLVLMQPGLLILDEPTNHINFRHIPILIKAISEYKGAIILISHMLEFVEKIKVDEYLDLAKL